MLLYLFHTFVSHPAQCLQPLWVTVFYHVLKCFLYIYSLIQHWHLYDKMVIQYNSSTALCTIVSMSTME